MTVANATVVEVTDRGTDTPQYATRTKRPVGASEPDDAEVYVWVRYDNGCVVPIREYHVRVLTAEQVSARLNDLARQAAARDKFGCGCRCPRSSQCGCGTCMNCVAACCAPPA